jgi:hypothetical protein
MLQWVWANREWIFSGVGVTVIASFVGWRLYRDPEMLSKQVQSGGHESFNLQAGRNINIGKRDFRHR